MIHDRADAAEVRLVGRVRIGDREGADAAAAAARQEATDAGLEPAAIEAACDAARAAASLRPFELVRRIGRREHTLRFSLGGEEYGGTLAQVLLPPHTHPSHRPFGCFCPTSVPWVLLPLPVGVYPPPLPSRRRKRSWTSGVTPPLGGVPPPSQWCAPSAQVQAQLDEVLRARQLARVSFFGQVLLPPTPPLLSWSL